MILVQIHNIKYMFLYVSVWFNLSKQSTLLEILDIIFFSDDF